MATNAEEKIAADLRTAIASDVDVQADIMVQLESPKQALSDSCADSAAMDRAQRATCVTNSLQQFAEQAQQPVKDLLAQHPDEFSSSRFLWINNSVSIKGAKGALVLALAQLDTVQTIATERIFQLTKESGESVFPGQGIAMQ